MVARLGEAERGEALAGLEASGWSAVPDRDAIRKTWKFRSFSEAWGFLSQVALAAEKLDHHPELSNFYNVVEATLSTRSCGGLSALDLKLAGRMDRIAGEAEARREA